MLYMFIHKHRFTQQTMFVSSPCPPPPTPHPHPKEKRNEQTLFVFGSREKILVCVMISVWQTAGWPAWPKNLNIAIFSDTMNVINVEMCMMLLLL